MSHPSRRTRSWCGRLAALGPVFVLAALPGRAGDPADPPEDGDEIRAPVENADCPFDADRSGREVQDRIRQLSRQSELLRPSLARAERPAGGTADVPILRNPRNLVDAEIFAKMRADGVAPAARSTDEEFLRRATLDLTGRIPDASAVAGFLADPRPDKRDRLVDRLLVSDAFVDRWTIWFGDLIENVRRTSNNGTEYPSGRNAYAQWIHESIRTGKPYDTMVRELLTSTGDNFAHGPSNFWVRYLSATGPVQDTYDNQFAAASEKFLGVPALCTSCHDGAGHTDLVNVYLSLKKRNEFWASAAFFAQTTAKGITDAATKNRKYELSDNTTGAYNLNTTSGNRPPRQPLAGGAKTVAPAFYLTGETPQAGTPLRQEFARMLTSHPQFARAAVNYLWKEMFGLGLVEPVAGFDLLRLDPLNVPPGWAVQPTHPELLERLATSFRSGGYDLRAVLRTIATSETYQLSSRYTPGGWNDGLVTYFARRLVRRLPSEMLLDAVFSSTGVAGSVTVAGLPPVTRAGLLPDPTEGGSWSGFLNTFQRGTRDGSPRSSDTSTVQALLMLNDTMVTSRVKSGTKDSVVQRTLKATQKPDEIVTALYLATLSRHPTEKERTDGVAYLTSGTLAARTEDLQWALLNRLEFLFY